MTPEGARACGNVGGTTNGCVPFVPSVDGRAFLLAAKCRRWRSARPGETSLAPTVKCVGLRRVREPSPRSAMRRVSAVGKEYCHHEVRLRCAPQLERPVDPPAHRRRGHHLALDTQEGSHCAHWHTDDWCFDNR